MKKMLALLIFVILMLFPVVASSDCVELRRATGWFVQGAHTIIFYEGVRPVALVQVPYCNITPSSTVRLVKGYICDTDDIVIDGETCRIMSISSAATSSF
jgi:hypothetical protein